ncbi:hypothetical protein U0070_003284 [Myodes glareolus]|uniref:Uncharacterized protein n=1 Tax=Myodes glareolus TaxID=447135 RepID=A0AAW0HTB0_MYOGA
MAVSFAGYYLQQCLFCRNPPSAPASLPRLPLNFRPVELPRVPAYYSDGAYFSSGIPVNSPALSLWTTQVMEIQLLHRFRHAQRLTVPKYKCLRQAPRLGQQALAKRPKDDIIQAWLPCKEKETQRVEVEWTFWGSVIQDPTPALNLKALMDSRRSTLLLEKMYKVKGLGGGEKANEGC